MQFTDEHELFRKTVRDFVEREINPHVDAWEDAAGLMTFGEAIDEAMAFRIEEGGEVEVQDFGATLYRVQVTVSDRRRDLVTLETLRLGDPP